MQSLYNLLSDGLPLKATGILIGLALVGSHLFALLRPAPTQAWLKRFPRDKMSGIVLLAISLVWSWTLIKYMDLGEFYVYRKWALIILPVVYFLVVKFANEFLSVRALGTLLLLLAAPILSASDGFQQPTSRLLLPLLCYAWVTVALFWVGMPFIMRNQIAWLTKLPIRFKAAAIGGVAYGVILLVCALTW